MSNLEFSKVYDIGIELVTEKELFEKAAKYIKIFNKQGNKEAISNWVYLLEEVSEFKGRT